MVNKKTISIAVMAMIAMISMTGCPAGTDLSDVGATVGIESVDAPKISLETFDYGVNISWSPVLNASRYNVFRAEKNEKGKFVKEILLRPVNAPSNTWTDVVSSAKTSVQNDVTYRYRVEAVTAKETLSDNNSTKTIAVSGIKAKGSKVPAAENVTAEFYGDYLYVEFNVPEYLGTNNASVTYTYDVTGLPEGTDLFGTFNASLDDTDGSYVSFESDSSIVANKVKYTITTRWSDDYYAENTVTGEVEKPTAGKILPGIDSITDTATGIKITFRDYFGAEYKLYKAEDGLTFTEVTVTPTKEDYKCDDIDGIRYTYLDTDVELGKEYRYVLTGTLDGKALEFNYNAVKSKEHTTALSWAPNFQAVRDTYHNDNSDDVYLSWTVEEGWTYEILRCLVSADGHTETDVTPLGEFTGKINDVKVVKDKITKTAGFSIYQYTLIGKKGDTVRKAQGYIWGFTDYVDPTFSISNASITDGTTDFVVRADKSFDKATFKFYRAEQRWESSYYISYCYVAEYSDITSSLVLVGTTDDYPGNTNKKNNQYSYKDTSKKNSGSKYVYYLYRTTDDGEVSGGSIEPVMP